MMNIYFEKPYTVFVEAGVSTTVILLTLGELGIPSDSVITPDEMKVKRRHEFVQSMTALGTHGVILDFPDLYMSFLPLSQLVPPVLAIVREKQCDVIFAIDEQEVTPEFDHPDHTTAGEVARFVSASSNVSYFYPEIPASKERPALYLWTTNPHVATHAIDLSWEDRERRNAHLKELYPSQFSAVRESEWVPIFDRITQGVDGQHRELYRKVR